MIYWIKTLYLWLLPPGLFILACGWAAWKWRREPALSRLAVCLALLVWLLSMPAFSGLLIGWLESRHEAPRQSSGDVVVLLAGGAVAGNPDVDGMDTLTGDMANRCFLQAKNAYHCSRRSNGPGSAFLLLATSHKRMANPVTWTVKNNEMTVVH